MSPFFADALEQASVNHRKISGHGQSLENRRSLVLRVRFTADEKSKLQKLANQDGVKLSTWVRKRLLG